MLSSLVSLALLYLAALIIPGPNLLLLTHTAASSSRSAARAVASGIAVGTLLWVTVAVFGVQKVFDAAPMLQTALRLAGGLYLLYMAWGLFAGMWRERKAASTDGSDSQAIKAEAPAAAARTVDDKPGSRLADFRRGLLTNLTNPKSFAFWTSVAIVSIAPDADLLTRVLAVLMVGLMGLLWHFGLAFLFSTAPAQRAYLRARPLLSAVTGTVMAIFGVRLLWGLRS